ncbi:hypothetical protein [Bradyrhizobium neotropicale]|uniref:hypothetical protein n=1 Tax=Bradyrhizobium neotropicale TaxID=1497615 RepID=UPI000AB12999|nr:hypothetical protein [Bradyrhizobium neotropicale]
MPAKAAAGERATSSDEIIDLIAGELWSETAPSTRKRTTAAIAHNVNRYTDAIGLMELRQAIACEISADPARSWSAEEIAVTSGYKGPTIRKGN